MFTIGIFSTNIPYIAFVAFYVWFLVFGKEEIDDAIVCSTDISQIQIECESDFSQFSLTDFHFYNYTVGETAQHVSYIFSESGEKRTHTFSGSLFVQQYLPGNLFCRPPPTFC